MEGFWRRGLQQPSTSLAFPASSAGTVGGRSRPCWLCGSGSPPGDPTVMRRRVVTWRVTHLGKSGTEEDPWPSSCYLSPVFRSVSRCCLFQGMLSIGSLLTPLRSASLPPLPGLCHRSESFLSPAPPASSPPAPGITWAFSGLVYKNVTVPVYTALEG